jgi:YHS domain-containing protein
MASKAKDPVCGMKVKKSKAAAVSEYKGKTYYFCAESCKGKFDKEPEKYIAD